MDIMEWADYRRDRVFPGPLGKDSWLQTGRGRRVCPLNLIWVPVCAQCRAPCCCSRLRAESLRAAWRMAAFFFFYDPSPFAEVGASDIKRRSKKSQLCGQWMLAWPCGLPGSFCTWHWIEGFWVCVFFFSPVFMGVTMNHSARSLKSDRSWSGFGF